MMRSCRSLLRALALATSAVAAACACPQVTSRQFVVDEDLRIVGTRDAYVCDMSVMPFSSAANPVRTLVALALRLSRRLG